jgi:hypothetical protein
MFKPLVNAAISFGIAVTGMVIHHPTTHHKPSHPMVRMVDCEDVDIQPCITKDEGQWRKVTSYNPYRYIVVKTCKTAKGGPSYPCVWTKKDHGKFLYYK